ncbi:vegetative incompatibility protein HET-E-1-like [Protopterus annectens]|uniref:vegetative incompatibility protein HET-E-1-like n=1 Tax=Protopterus annectens TaxID=7888 RepID=UPI001CF9F3B5|nr:vegetative incompatibility protein HET-E-1-like [Protopterus annectens]
MSMQKQLSVRECHSRPITALGYHAARREFLTGCEDGVIKWWDLETGQMTASVSEHSGMITSFLYWAVQKLLLSSSNDETVLVWSVGATLLDRIMTGSPVFSMAINFRRNHLICGLKRSVSVFSLDLLKQSDKVINSKGAYNDFHHKDVVSCVVCLDTRIYTAGYDRHLIIFETSSYPQSQALTVVSCNPRAHDAGITDMLLVRERDNTRLLTGSFDKTVRVWSQDGQMVQKLSIFSNVITGLCYVPPTGLVWIASGDPHPAVFDAKSGEIVSNFIDGVYDSGFSQLQRLSCLPDSGHVIGSDGYRQVTVWKYKKAGCSSVLHGDQPMECLSYTQKAPILLFTGHSDGTFVKWERRHFSRHTYSKESFRIKERNTLSRQKRAYTARPSKRYFNEHKKKQVPSYQILDQLEHRPSTAVQKNKAATRLVRCLFVEELDLLVLSSEDGNIYVWGFDDFLASTFRKLEAKIAQWENTEKPDFWSDRLLDAVSSSDAEMDEKNASSSASKRLSGFICKKVLAGHFQSVTGLVVIGKDCGFNTIYLLSGGWDCRLCIWDLEQGIQQDTFHNADLEGWNELREVACDGAILDLAYSPKRNEFAYSSTDGLIYVRHFSPVGHEMRLLNVLQGHEAEVSCIIWHPLVDRWVSGSEDGTIRVWSEDGMTCEQVLDVKGGITCLNIDKVNGCIIAGSNNTLWVYDTESYHLVQRHTGHTDSIRSVIHIPRKKQYMSASWDCTVRIWNAYSKVLG